MGRLGGHAFYKAKGLKPPDRRKPEHRRRVVFLADICTCGHERHMHTLFIAKIGARGQALPPNFGRWHCQRCTCPMFVLDAPMTKAANKDLFGDVVPR